MDNYTIRMAKKEDAKSLLEIYAPYVVESSVTFEYDVPSICEFENRIENTLSFFPYLVMEKDGEVIGYAYASWYRVRKAYQYSCELSIYLKQSCRKKGLGNILYDALENVLKKQGFHNLYACITYPNDESVRFHTKRGFKINAHFHACGYKFDTWYDMVWMEKIIKEHTVHPEPLKNINDINVEEYLDENFD